MLELAAYFVGARYDFLEGLSGPYSDLMLGPDAWMMVGTAPQIAPTRLPIHCIRRTRRPRPALAW